MAPMSITPSLEPFHHEGGPVGVLLCHGFTGSPAAVRPWAEALAAEGHTVSVPLLPGHGTVWQELNVVSWLDWYDCVDAEYVALRSRCERVFVCGLSMGGALALRLAAHHADVAGVVLVNPSLGARNPFVGFAGVLRYLMPTYASIGHDIARPGVDEGAYDTTPVQGVYNLQRLWADVKSTLDLVTCPLLVFRSAVDHVVPASSTETILRQVSSMDTREVVLERSYHVATLDYDDEVIVAGSLEFIERVSSAAVG